MEINGFFLAGSIVCLIMIFVHLFDMVKHQNEGNSGGDWFAFLFLTGLAIVMMGLAFGGR